jgi:hypothetical protein
MSSVTITTPANNHIVVSSTRAQGLGSVNRIGPAQIARTSSTNAMIGDIFFKFYRCDDSSGSKVYTALDVSSAIANSTIQSRFLTMLMIQYYQDTTIVNDIGGSFPDLAERLSGVGTPTTNLATSITMPGSSANFVEFVGMGLGSYVGAEFINGNSTERASSVWGTRVGQVHLTDVDPTVSPVNALYDNSDAGCWSFDRYNCDGIIVYTNLFGSAFSASGASCWSQMLCVWPILASTLSAEYACVFNNYDQSFLKSGLGYFARDARVDTYYGWAGNYLQSIFNDWGIPVISPIWCMSDLAMASYVSYSTLGQNNFNNYGSLTDQAKAFRFVGPKAAENVDAVNEKAVRSLLPLLWANECRWGTSSAVSGAVPNFETSVSNLGYASVTNYMNAALGTSPEGYNAHIYKYILNNESHPSNTPTSTRSYITNGVSWSSKLAAQPSLANCFTQESPSYPKYSKHAVEDFYPTGAGTYGTALINRIEDGSLIVVEETTPAQNTLLQNWVYTP